MSSPAETKQINHNIQYVYDFAKDFAQPPQDNIMADPCQAKIQSINIKVADK